MCHNTIQLIKPPTKLAHEEARTKYVTKVLTNYTDLKTVASEAFGGRRKMLGRTLFDNFDPAKIYAWAENVGSKLIE